jgi:pimeloyl-ACP methyl ester carboxylesterase
MAHGIGGTRDSGLLPFAEAFADAGLDVLLFEFARTLEGVDPERIVLWGTSWSGGHVVYIAADDHRIGAVISQTPDLDGIRTLKRIGDYAGPAQQLKVTMTGIRDALAGLRGREPVMIPVVAPPGELGAMTSEEAVPGMRRIAGPTWRNEITGRATFAEWGNRAITRMDRVGCPILVQIADRDSVAPPSAARAAAWRAKGRVQVHEYPCAHFDMYVGEWRERAIHDQLRFLRHHLGAGAEARASTLKV